MLSRVSTWMGDRLGIHDVLDILLGHKLYTLAQLGRTLYPPSSSLKIARTQKCAHWTKVRWTTLTFTESTHIVHSEYDTCNLFTYSRIIISEVERGWSGELRFKITSHSSLLEKCSCQGLRGRLVKLHWNCIKVSNQLSGEDQRKKKKL